MSLVDPCKDCPHNKNSYEWPDIKFPEEIFLMDDLKHLARERNYKLRQKTNNEHRTK